MDSTKLCWIGELMAGIFGLERANQSTATTRHTARTALFGQGMRGTDLEKALDAWTQTVEVFLISIDEDR
jgi:hypothetical protein